MLCCDLDNEKNLLSPALGVKYVFDYFHAVYQII